MSMEFSLKPFPKYPKIQSLYKRDEQGRFTGEFSLSEFEYLYDNSWIGTEKIHGTNIRLAWQPTFSNSAMIKGRTDKADIPTPLHEVLSQLVERIGPVVLENFATVEEVVLFGEGYGKGIQKPGKRYRSTAPEFILFDVWVNGWWLRREDVEATADVLGLATVPVRFRGTLSEAENCVRQGIHSTVAEDETLNAEGLVLFPAVPLFNRLGNRIMTKLKTEDYT